MQKNKNQKTEKEERLTIEFTKGAVKQLKDLKKHYHVDNEFDVVKLGISMLQYFRQGRKIKGMTLHG